MVEEARLAETETGLKPVSEGWFVVNVRDASSRASCGASVETETGAGEEAYAVTGFPGHEAARPDFWRELPWVQPLQRPKEIQ